ncbi:hypothetical protein MVES1_001113 [Malassezia vespertilionis]|uniref:uncharacterized protein n=1 Tax=Malassezia vespertilionis TaxID=2020962 RepID=UPI0024B07AFD|nr:uncharacterized protein MVES1_001113 [Malassezia vespertilionis]WFD05779.1 hypothetical protein MVES1_001113 [Malassezia vespertilionis]
MKEEPKAELSSRLPPILRAPFWRRSPPAAAPDREKIEMADMPLQAAEKDKDVPNKTPRLQFAHAHMRVHPQDLPYEYDPDELYRGLDSHVTAHRTRRRQERRKAPRLDTDDEDASDSSTSSSSSNESNAAAHAFSRIRALFGDDSDSSGTDSSTSSSDDESDGGTSTTSGISRISAVVRRRGRDDVSMTDSPAGLHAFSPWTPRIGGALGARRRRRQRQREKARRQANAVHIQKASRNARRNARRLRRIAGGATEFTLYVPTAPNVNPDFSSQSWRAVEKQLLRYFQYFSQDDGHGGDLGAPHELDLSQDKPLFGLRATQEEDVVAPQVQDMEMVKPEGDFEKMGMHDTWYNQERNTGKHMSDMPLASYFRGATGDLTKSPMPFSGQYTPRRSTFRSVLKTPRDPIIPEEAEIDELDIPILGEPMLALPPELEQNQAADATTIASSIPASPPLLMRANPWWLDICCPTYKTMQQLSQHFPLHPLTVEDILKQEQREKVENYDRLGYYFVVIRALDEQYFRFHNNTSEASDGEKGADISPAALQARFEKKLIHDPLRQELTNSSVNLEICKDKQGKEGLEGLAAGSVSLYLVVFAHGVLSFSFEDMKKYTDHVRAKLMHELLIGNHNADWIVHGLYDAVVDVFAPYVYFLQMQVANIEALSNDMSVSPFVKRPPRTVLGRLIKWIQSLFRKKNPLAGTALEGGDEQDTQYAMYLTKRSKKSPLFSTADALLQSQFILSLSHTREIVTGLSRLLSPKIDVLRGIEKRLADSSHDFYDDNIILLYMEDIFDHVASMVAQLHERDKALTHTHWSFLTRSRIRNRRYQKSNSYVLLLAATVMATTLLCQMVTSSFSMNVWVPGISHRTSPNDDDPIYTHHYAFGGIVVGLASVPVIMFSYYKFLKRLAKRRSSLQTNMW